MQLLRCLSGGVRNAVIRICDIAVLVHVNFIREIFYFIFYIFNTQLKRMGWSEGNYAGSL